MEEKIFFEKEVCDFLKLPSIPKKEWDGKSSFKNGVAVTQIANGFKAYAVASFDAEVDKEPNVVKVFASETFYGIEKVFITPSYMDVDVEKADLDDESKRAAERLAQEAEEMTGSEDEDGFSDTGDNGFYFDDIHNMEEAVAWLRQYNAANGIKGKVPNDEETVKLRLLAIYTELQNKEYSKSKKK